MAMSNLFLIGLLGRKRVGKDTVGDFLGGYGFRRYSIISWLREKIRVLSGQEFKSLYPFLIISIDLDYSLPYKGEKSEDERFILQDLAAQFRLHDPFFFVDRMIAQIYKFSVDNPEVYRKIVVTDVRTGSDVVALQRFVKTGWPYGRSEFRLWKINRPDVEQDNHITEREIDMIDPARIHKVFNNDSLISVLKNKVREACEPLVHWWDGAGKIIR